MQTMGWGVYERDSLCERKNAFAIDGIRAYCFDACSHSARLWLVLEHRHRCRNYSLLPLNRTIEVFYCHINRSFDLFCTRMQRITHWTMIKSCISTNMKQNTNLRISRKFMKCQIQSEHKCDGCSTWMLKFCWICCFLCVILVESIDVVNL